MAAFRFLLYMPLLIIAVIFMIFPRGPVLAADPTTSVTIAKYASDGTTILEQTTVTCQWMQANLPVQGDGTTHYYHQDPTFDYGNIWDPGETVNIETRDFGAAMGTDVKDLCSLVTGGASEGDTITIKSIDGFSKTFDYEDVYYPEADQGKLVIAWYNPTFGGYVPGYNDGMRLIFFAETTNSSGLHVFGNWDMHQTLAETRWYLFDNFWPSSGGLSVKWVSDIEIFTDEAPPSTPTPTPTLMPTPTPTSMPTPTPTPTLMPTPTPTPTTNPSPTPSATPASTPTDTPVSTPRATPTPTTIPTATTVAPITPMATPTAVPSSTATALLTPAYTPAVTPATTPTLTPIATPTVLITPTAAPVATHVHHDKDSEIGAGAIAGLAVMSLVALGMLTWLIVALIGRR